MPTPTRLLPALVLVALLAACAEREPARDGTSGAAGDFAALDSDGDDVVDQQEFAEAFERFDLDGDGAIEAAESAAIVYEADADRDGRVTRAEFEAIDLSRLAADANLDGRLSRAEIERFTRDRREQLGPRSARRGALGELDRENRWLQFRF
jgi:hypothetical protein